MTERSRSTDDLGFIPLAELVSNAFCHPEPLIQFASKPRGRSYEAPGLEIDGMYFMYVDESGDTGLGEGASDYFVLSGLVIHEGHWNRVLSSMAENRKEIYSRYGLATHFELHATKMVGRAKKSEHGLSRTDAVLLYRDFLRYEATLDYVRIINVVVDKRDKDESCDVFCLAWDRLINRFENTIRHKNFPSAWQEKPDGESGFLIVDEL